MSNTMREIENIKRELEQIRLFASEKAIDVMVENVMGRHERDIMAAKSAVFDAEVRLRKASENLARLESGKDMETEVVDIKRTCSASSERSKWLEKRLGTLRRALVKDSAMEKLAKLKAQVAAMEKEMNG